MRLPIVVACSYQNMRRRREGKGKDVGREEREEKVRRCTFSSGEHVRQTQQLLFIVSLQQYFSIFEKGRIAKNI